MASVTPTVTITGTGTVGEVKAGWSVTEDATPVAPGDTTASVGKVSLAADRRPDSEFINNNPITTVTPLGTVSGIINNVTTQGRDVGFSHDSVLGRFNAARVLPPVGSGEPVAPLDMLVQLFGQKRCSLSYPTQKYFSLAGHDSGFDVNGAELKGIDRTTGRYVGNTYRRSWAFRDAVGTRTWFRRDSRVHAGTTTGFSLNIGGYSYIMFRRNIAGTTALSRFTVILGPDDATAGTGKTITVEIDHGNVTPVVRITGTYRLAGVSTPINVSTSLSALNLTTGVLQTVIGLQWISATQFQVTATVANTGNLATTATVTTGVLTTPTDENAQPFTITNCRSLYYVDSTTPLSLMVEYENPLPYDVAITGYSTYTDLARDDQTTLYRPVIGGNLNAWDYLKQCAAGLGVEYTPVNDRITVRTQGTRTLVYDDEFPSPQLSLNNQATGRSITAVNQNTKLASRAIVSDARDDNTIYEVPAGIVRTFTVQTDTSASFVHNPEHWGTDPDWIGDQGGRKWGAYAVVDASGALVGLTKWAEFYGGVTASLGALPGFIDITLTGPRNDIPGSPGPYRFAFPYLAGFIPAFSITGRGTIASPSEVSILTGADPDRTPNEVATTVRNVALGSKELVYTRCAWTAAAASGGQKSLTMKLPVKIATSLGVVPGMLLRYQDALWRVVSDTVTRTSVDLTLMLHTTTADIDAVWAGKTTAQFDAFWAGYETGDVALRPLRS